MTDREILQKAYNQACLNGYQGWADVEDALYRAKRYSYWEKAMSFCDLEAYRCQWYDIRGIIFDHNFCKAFWANPCEWDRKDWKGHLQYMVLLECPLTYLEKFLDV